MCQLLEIPLDARRREEIARADAEALTAMIQTLRMTRALP